MDGKLDRVAIDLWRDHRCQGRIQDFVNGGPKSEGEARIEGAKRPRIEGEA